MLAIIFGILFVLFAAFSVIPFSGGLGWTDEFIFVLKGVLPLGAMLLGILCVLIGIADCVDRAHAKKEAQLQKEFEESQQQK